jgi:hypothetical protein
MTLYNGSIDTIYYVVQGNLTASNSETQITIVFKPSAITAVLLWGGHIGNRNDWGYTSGSPNSAGGISGSPFHMRLISWSYGSLGSQDRGLAGGAVTGPPFSLPVSLINFTASPALHGIELNWSTSSETNNDYFTLEHSPDGITYTALDNIDGAGNSNATLMYSLVDDNPFAGTNYYRLLQTDFDGTQKFFEPISIFTGNHPFELSVVNVYPNPFTGDFAISYNSENRGITRLEIRNSTGMLIYTEPLNSVKGINRYEFSNKINLPSGVYSVTLLQGNDKTESKRIVKY